MNDLIVIICFFVLVFLDKEKFLRGMACGILITMFVFSWLTFYKQNNPQKPITNKEFKIQQQLTWEKE